MQIQFPPCYLFSLPFKTLSILSMLFLQGYLLACPVTGANSKGIVKAAMPCPLPSKPTIGVNFLFLVCFCEMSVMIIYQVMTTTSNFRDSKTTSVLLSFTDLWAESSAEYLFWSFCGLSCYLGLVHWQLG
jgi:hypothetical protein